MAELAKYSIVVPAYNEEAVIHETYRQLKQVMEGTGDRYELIFVNDGSSDQTSFFRHTASRIARLS